MLLSDSGGHGTLLTLQALTSYPQPSSYPEDSPNACWDSTDGTRTYPGDSTDETNS